MSCCKSLQLLRDIIKKPKKKYKIQREVALEREESARKKISLAEEQQKELKKQVKDAKAA